MQRLTPDRGMRCGSGDCLMTMRTRRNCASGARPVRKRMRPFWRRSVNGSNAAYHTHNTRAGHYVLRTSHTEWSVEETVRTYWRLTELEATFQSLKSELGLRPVWHQLSKRIEGHLFIAVLALYGVNVIRTRLAAHGINHKWATLRTKLGRWQRTTIAVTTTDGSRIEVRRDVRPDPTASAIAKSAGTPYMPQKRIRRLGKP